MKKAGFPAVEKMRTIQLMMAAFNMNNKRTGRLAMRRAEKSNLCLGNKEAPGKIER